MKATTLKIVTGDVTCPQGAGNKIITHIVNNRGGWGKGLVLAISKRWSEPENRYRQWYRHKEDSEAGRFVLGQVQYVSVTHYLLVANMLAQDGFANGSRRTAVDFTALRNCLKSVRQTVDSYCCNGKPTSVHMPRIGCGLAGAKWTDIYPLIQDELLNHGVTVTVYDY